MKKFFKFGCLTFVMLGALFAVLLAINGSPTPEEKLAETINTTPEQASKVIDILKEIGVENFKSIEHDELLDGMNIEGEKGYRINTSEINNIILYVSREGTVNTVRWADNDLYGEGNHISKINDYVLTLKEKSNLQYQCQETIKGILKAPSTAKFPNINNWAFSKKDGVITVQSYVDAENAFGANIRSEFQFIIENGNIASLVFDGQEYVNK